MWRMQYFQEIFNVVPKIYINHWLKNWQFSFKFLMFSLRVLSKIIKEPPIERNPNYFGEGKDIPSQITPITEYSNISWKNTSEMLEIIFRHAWLKNSIKEIRKYFSLRLMEKLYLCVKCFPPMLVMEFSAIRNGESRLILTIPIAFFTVCAQECNLQALLA
jgi:hypothetical protein